MSLHNSPAYNHEHIRKALEEHGMIVDRPSMVSDGFRLGWVAAIDAISKAQEEYNVSEH